MFQPPSKSPAAQQTDLFLAYLRQHPEIEAYFMFQSKCSGEMGKNYLRQKINSKDFPLKITEVHEVVNRAYRKLTQIKD